MNTTNITWPKPSGPAPLCGCTVRDGALHLCKTHAEEAVRRLVPVAPALPPVWTQPYTPHAPNRRDWEIWCGKGTTAIQSYDPNSHTIN